MTIPTPEPVGSHVSQWGEGPIWHRDRLLYVDIEAHKITGIRSGQPVRKKDLGSGRTGGRSGGTANAADSCMLGIGDSRFLMRRPARPSASPDPESGRADTALQ